MRKESKRSERRKPKGSQKSGGTGHLSPGTACVPARRSGREERQKGGEEWRNI